MKKIAFLFFLSLPVFVIGQLTDSLVIKEVDSLIDLSKKLLRERKVDTSFQIIEQAERIVNERLEDRDYYLAKVLHQKGQVLRRFPEKRMESLLTVERAREIMEKRWSEEPEYGNILWTLGFYYTNLTHEEEKSNVQLEKAIKYLETAKDVFEHALGKEHNWYNRILSSLPLPYRRLFYFEKALEVLLERHEISARVYGKKHIYYENSLANLAVTCHRIFKYEMSEAYFLECLPLTKELYGEDHGVYGTNVNNLGSLYRTMGQYKKAEKLYKQSIRIYEKINPTQGMVVVHKKRLASLYYEMGEYKKAEAIFLEYMKDWKEPGHLNGKRNEAGFIKKQAFLYWELGQLDKVEMLLERRLNLLEKVYEKGHPNIANALQNLAVLYLKTGRLEKAEKLLNESLNDIENNLSKENPAYATILESAGNFYRDMGDYNVAEEMYQQSLGIIEKALGNKDHQYASILHNWAILLKNTGDNEKASKFLLDSKAIRASVYGKAHKAYAESIGALAKVSENLQDFEKTEQYLNEIITQQKSKLTEGMTFLSEAELLAYSKVFEQDLSNVYNLTQQRIANNIPIGSLSELSFDNALFYKGLSLNTVNRINRLSENNVQAKDIHDEIKINRRRLAFLYTKPKEERRNIDELEEKVNSLEKELTQTVSEYGDALRQVNWKEVQASLKEKEVAIEFVHYKVQDPKPTDGTMYAALLLKPNSNKPRFIPLFEEKSLDSLLNLHQARRADYVNDLYVYSQRGVEVSGKPKKTLFELIWKPLEKELEGIETIYFSPSGLLHRINLAAIPIDLETKVGDYFSLSQVGSTRQLVIPQKGEKTGDEVVLYGGVEFDFDSTSFAFAADNIHSEAYTNASRGELSFGFTDRSLRGGGWNFLPWTEREVSSIATVLQASNYKTTTKIGVDATEESFRSLGHTRKSPLILHVATHGYFYPDPESVGSKQVAVEREPVFKISEHPMIRSGLIMAGGNHVWEGKPPLEGREDGILTAYEISQMDLSNTELVVLSACETGLGDIEGNEGVYGLQRAFKIAGAKYLIMSLWQVPDKQTMEFMKAFYKNWLKEQMTIPDAFRLTQKQMCERFFDPYDWAGFVLIE